jgi:acetophenone carboxylase
MILDMTFTERLKPEPFDPVDLEYMQRLDSVDFEIAAEKLNMIVEEAKDIFVRSGVSSMLRSGDVAVGIYTAKGDMVTAACGSYLYAVCGQPQIKYICARWKDHPTVGVRPGDIFYANDAVYGGVHNPDQFAFIPIFYGDRLIAWAAAACHQPETGACEPGGMPVSARTRYDEGLKLSPIRIGEDFVLREDLLEMMANMVSRAPHMQLIDLKARVLSCDRVRIRVEQLAKDKGPEFLMGVFTRVIAMTSEAARARISSWVDGTFRSVVFTDHIGIDEGLVRGKCTLIKRGERLHFDFTGTSPETPGPYNAFKHTMVAHCAMYLYGFPFNDLPLSAGIWEPIDFTVPRGTCLNANPESAVANSVLVCSLAMCLTHLTMSKLLFASGQIDQATAPYGNNGDAYVMSGSNQWGIPFTDMLAYPLTCEGGGARHNSDGVDAWGFPWGPWGRGPDVEEEEDERPHVHLFQKILKDSCGHGKYRGGAGITVAWMVQGAPAAVYQSIVKSSRVQALQSFFGGYPPPTHPGIQLRNTGIPDRMRLGSADIPADVYELVLDESLRGLCEVTTNLRKAMPFAEGDVFVGCSHGGVGYGDVLERDPALVMEDVQNGIISDWVARNVYCVAYDPVTMTVLRTETQEQRNAARKARLASGRSYQSFFAEWADIKPPDNILKYYGTWPDAASGAREENEDQGHPPTATLNSLTNRPDHEDT